MTDSFPSQTQSQSQSSPPSAELPYRPAANTWDDYVDPQGTPRPVGDSLRHFLVGLGPRGLRHRYEQLRQLVRDHGVAFSVPGDARAGDREWQLDMLPQLVDAPAFAALNRGIIQRARLLEAVLADVMGPQRLVREGWLPARLVLGNPAFLRPCHGLRPRRRLVLYAADLTRLPNGEFRLLRDRTQSPTGLGYTLENRLVVSRTLEEPFRTGNVERLAPFFHALREALAALSPTKRDHPSVVLQGSGAWSPTYFEQAFLAQYLGFPLVEGGDLTVRDRRVVLKTLGGLSPVDVIFRQPGDDFCDPLELRPDSSLGVPGLVEATRSHHVAVGNALGAGLLQSTAFLPFLPRIAEGFFQDPLSLESAPTFWCGDPAALSHVLANLDSMVVRPAWPGFNPTLVMGAQLRGEAREDFVALLRATPEAFVGQEAQPLGHAPTLVGTDIVPRPCVLRLYAVAKGDEHLVMPGGLSLASPTANELNIAAARGALAKDVWVQGATPVKAFSLLPPASRVIELSRGGADLPSRSADNLFWLGRYAERSESLARLARHLLAQLADGPDRVDATGDLPILFEVLATATECPAPERDAEFMPWLAKALCSAAAPGSLHNTLRSAVRSAASVRDRLSADTFRVIGQLFEESTRGADMVHVRSFGALSAFLDRVVTSLSALAGLATESMTRGHGWRFLDMGRRLERAVQLVSLLRVSFASGEEQEGALLETLLDVADSGITYRRRYLAGLHPAAVVDLLLLDDGNPRAVLFQIAALVEHLDRLPGDTSRARLRPEQRLALAALARLQLLDLLPACAPREGKPPVLYELLEEIERDLTRLSEYLCGGYLNHAVIARPLALSVNHEGT
jgi:uncharacterized circularly permuted ATP-grasp superfamily protein/uncharacterized alpha-E superfamily protein